MSWRKRRHVSFLTIRKKKKPEGKTKISVQQSRNVRLATIVSPIDRRNDRTCSKKKKKREFLSAPLSSPSGTPLFARRFTFISAFLAFLPLHRPPLPSLSLRFRPHLAQLSLPPPLSAFYTTFAYPAGAITTAGNKKVTFTTGWLRQTAGNKAHKTIIDAGLQSTRLPKRETLPPYRSGVWCHPFKCTRFWEIFLKINIRRNWIRIWRIE